MKKARKYWAFLSSILRGEAARPGKLAEGEELGSNPLQAN
jgi:hypothetical protein